MKPTPTAGIDRAFVVKRVIFSLYVAYFGPRCGIAWKKGETTPANWPAVKHVVRQSLMEHPQHKAALGEVANATNVTFGELAVTLNPVEGENGFGGFVAAMDSR